MSVGRRFSDYLEFLRELDHLECPYFLEGGQAVNLWADFFSSTAHDVILDEFRPFTSKGCDVWVSVKILTQIRNMRGVDISESTSPVDGLIAVIRLRGDGDERRVDLMTNVYGIHAIENSRLFERSLVINGVRVLDPMYLLKSKCHCLMALPQADRQDERHLRMLCVIARSYIQQLLETACQGELDERSLIKELKILLKILKGRQVRQALDKVGVTSRNLIPIEAIRQTPLKKLHQFGESVLAIL